MNTPASILCDDVFEHVRLDSKDVDGLNSLSGPVGFNEARRLQIIHDSGLLSSNAGDPDFDRISALAARVLRTPICTINIIDATTSWMKSKYGPPPILALTSYSRNETICTYTILPESPDIFVVLDGSKDDRFKDTEGVKMGVRFYAGASIVLDDVKIGTICVIDFIPRTEFSLNDRTNLLDFAASVAILMKKNRDNYLGLAKERSKLLHDMSHNLRTPLTSLELIVKNLKNDLDTLSQADSDTTNIHRSNSRTPIGTSTTAAGGGGGGGGGGGEPRVNRRTLGNINEAEMAIRQLNMIVENSLSAVKVVLNTEANDNNIDEICHVLDTIKSIHFITSSLDESDKQLVWNYKNLDSYFKYTQQQTYPEVLKFVIINIIRQLHTHWELINIDFDYVTNNIPYMNYSTIIDGSLFVKISVSSQLTIDSSKNKTIQVIAADEEEYRSYMVDYELHTLTDSFDHHDDDGDCNYTHGNTATPIPPSPLFPPPPPGSAIPSAKSLNLPPSSLNSPPEKDYIFTRTNVNDRIQTQNSQDRLNSMMTCISPKSSTKSILELHNYVSSLQLRIIKQAVKCISGLFDVIINDPTSSHKNNIEFHMYIPCRIFKSPTNAIHSMHPIMNNGSINNITQQNITNIVGCNNCISEDVIRHHLIEADFSTQLTNHNDTNDISPRLFHFSDKTLQSIKPKILIIEDNVTVQKAMSRFLTKAGCEVMSAYNGRLGLTECQINAYDMIFVDFMMPVMSGKSLFLERYKWIQQQQLKRLHMSNYSNNNMKVVADESTKSFYTCIDDTMESTTNYTNTTTNYTNTTTKCPDSSMDTTLPIMNQYTLMIGMSASASPPECASSFGMGMHFFITKPISTEIMNLLVEAAKINTITTTTTTTASNNSDNNNNTITESDNNTFIKNDINTTTTTTTTTTMTDAMIITPSSSPTHTTINTYTSSTYQLDISDKTTISSTLNDEVVGESNIIVDNSTTTQMTDNGVTCTLYPDNMESSRLTKALHHIQSSSYHHSFNTIDHYKTSSPNQYNTIISITSL